MSDQTLDQKRAEHAIKQIQDLPTNVGHYVSYVSALPAQIVSSGLGQALATLLAAAGRQKKPTEDPHYRLCQHVASWLSDQIPELSSKGDANLPLAVLTKLAKNNQRTYIRAQAESLAYLNWLKKFGRALLKDQGPDSTKAKGAAPAAGVSGDE